jgi:hypothetical protein
MIQMGMCSTKQSKIAKKLFPLGNLGSITSDNSENNAGTCNAMPHDQSLKFLWRPDSSRKLLDMAESPVFQNDLQDIEQSNNVEDCFSKLSGCFNTLMKGSMKVLRVKKSTKKNLVKTKNGSIMIAHHSARNVIIGVTNYTKIPVIPLLEKCIV